MPNIKSAIKRVKTSEKRHQRNMANKSRLNTARRTFVSKITADDAAANEAAFRAFSSAVDKAAKAGVISKNAAARRKSRACSRITAKA